jgi:hypothetical protein
LLYDFAYFWVAGRALLTGGDPYTAVQPGAVQFGEVRFDNWFMYPLPAALGGAAVAWLPMQAASVVFVAAAFGLLAFALTADGWWRLPILMSAPALWCMTTGQWAPLTLAAAMTPAFAWPRVAKPTLGFAAFAYRPSWRSSGSALPRSASPSSFVRTGRCSGGTPHARRRASTTRSCTAAVWLAARPWSPALEDRRGAPVACDGVRSAIDADVRSVPAAPRRTHRLEAIAFSLWSYLVPWAMVFVITPPAADTKAETLPYMGRVLTLTMYLPALAVVLARRRST